MLEMLNRCDSLYKNLKDCDDKQTNPKKGNRCLSCIQNMFWDSNIDTYDCLKGLSAYIMRYGPLYVEEIFSFLLDSHVTYRIIANKRTNLKNAVYKNCLIEDIDKKITINIMSLGCGFGPDNIALNKHKTNCSLHDVPYNYIGYDASNLWNKITESKNLPKELDVLKDNINFKDIDIVFINKLFSTLVNHNKSQQFLDVLKRSLDYLPTSSYIVFNDINHKDKGRDDFDEFMINNGFQCLKRYHFGNGFNDFNKPYTPLSYYNVTTTNKNLEILPKFTNETIIFLYQKV